jgi:hypothetical protein
MGESPSRTFHVEQVRAPPKGSFPVTEYPRVFWTLGKRRLVYVADQVRDVSDVPRGTSWYGEPNFHCQVMFHVKHLASWDGLC